ncbi:MAG: molecular chaperone HtpG [Bacteroidia bacterium]|nr:molecular chaperone HtpG [Bacteroidia bacterium]MDG2042663.1 molecular chaperone HtpG [Bacteroidia bacterium]|tara:strand:+ start:15197 stop:17002 length:1806 start_codon:yes stop_codon:yes gene_type:complete
MQKGKVSVNTENIFPIIKKFLYTDNEIFLRELISNATDATNKLRVLSQRGEVKGDLGELKITVKIDEKKNTLTISDSGIGMTAEEIDKYINQIAFSGAEEFVEKFKDTKEDANIIGHFGLGFYSSFMVADKVEINSLSHTDGAEPAKWTCEGSTDFKITKGKRKKRGTDIILHINEESKDFLTQWKINELLNKYCKFLPVPIEFDKKTINDTAPLWKKNPSELKDEDYTDFYSKLYPMSEPPLFWIHLNVDYPFNLTGVLYFPKIKKEIDPNRNKIQLYSNQVYVTDNVEDIVPEYLMLLHGVIDSPDIPLNVSRSSLQADGAVKKITSHISKKVADKLAELHKADFEDYKAKWHNMSIFVKYGMLSDDKFYDRAKKICLLQNTDKEYNSIEEYIAKIEPNQTDKDGNRVALYTNDAEKQHSFIEAAKDKGYDVLLLDEVIDNHFVSNLEQKNEKFQLKRVDAETASKLIDKDEKNESVLNEDDTNKLKDAFEGVIDKEKYTINPEVMSPSDSFITITRSEWERRMSEMGGMGGMQMFGQMPEKYTVAVNTNHPLASKVLKSKGNKQTELLSQAINLAKLSQNLLTGKELSDFVKAQYANL